MWEGVSPERAEPLCRMLLVFPAGLVASMNLLGRMGKGRHSDLRLTALRERVAALTGLFAKGEGLLTSFGKGNESDATEPDVASLALDDDA